MATSTFTVIGMTCDHCVQAVRSEVGSIPGVASVEVDLASGQLTVQAPTEVDPSAVAAAIDEAGYELSP